MNLYICGIIDIVIVLGFALFMFLGYKEGFMHKFLNLSKGIGKYIITAFLVVPFGNLLFSIPFIKAPIYTKVFANLSNKVSVDLATASTTDILNDVGVPGFLHNFVINKLNLSAEGAEVVMGVSNVITKAILCLIALVLLILILTIGIMIMRRMVDSARESNETVKTVDGVMGMLLSALMFLIFIYIAFFVIAIMMQFAGAESAFTKFITTDMQLNTNKFRLSKFIYNSNILGLMVSFFKKI